MNSSAAGRHQCISRAQFALAVHWYSICVNQRRVIIIVKIFEQFLSFNERCLGRAGCVFVRQYYNFVFDASDNTCYRAHQFYVWFQILFITSAPAACGFVGLSPRVLCKNRVDSHIVRGIDVLSLNTADGELDDYCVTWLLVWQQIISRVFIMPK